MNDIGVEEIYEAGEGIQGERRDLHATLISLRLDFHSSSGFLFVRLYCLN